MGRDWRRGMGSLFCVKASCVCVYIMTCVQLLTCVLFCFFFAGVGWDGLDCVWFCRIAIGYCMGIVGLA